MKLHFIELPFRDGRTVCRWINDHNLAEYVIATWCIYELGITQITLRLPDDYPIETLESAKDGPG